MGLFGAAHGWGRAFPYIKCVINIPPALKLTAGQRSLTVVKAFVTAKKPCRTVTMTATT